MDEARRETILRSVERWLAQAAVPEVLPDGLEPAAADGPAPDLATLAGAVASLARESSLQGRAFRRVAEQLDALATAGDDAADPPASSERGASVPIEAVMDRHDSLRRCAEATHAAGSRLPRAARWFGAAAHLDGVGAGVALIESRARDLLDAHGVEPLAGVGEAFDARCMRAVGAVPASAGRPAGTIVNVVRAGYRSGDRVLRAAEVEVSSDGGTA